ncbi:hypothetical protein A176_006291 [Myxococcus hansupus]|uniref:Uncharacterized protein n=1 Tax=Pseudomyxococcus hansupus TaxID=1297742 RepID=A0A0H4X2J1_9BACT|nr:hypothetical protein A176_006291 [Myxococcus hansupus]
MRSWSVPGRRSTNLRPAGISQLRLFLSRFRRLGPAPPGRPAGHQATLQKAFVGQPTLLRARRHRA